MRFAACFAFSSLGWSMDWCQILRAAKDWVLQISEISWVLDKLFFEHVHQVISGHVFFLHEFTELAQIVLLVVLQSKVLGNKGSHPGRAYSWRILDRHRGFGFGLESIGVAFVAKNEFGESDFFDFLIRRIGMGISLAEDFQTDFLPNGRVGGAFTSMLCGFLGMMIATYSNARTTLACAHKGYTEGFNCAFRGGSVMGYALCSLGVLVLWVLLSFYRKAQSWLKLTWVGCVKAQKSHV